MSNRRLSEWECSNIANDLDRIDSYRSDGKTIDTASYFMRDSSEHLSEWDAMGIANDIDRINSYRKGGIFEGANAFIGFVVGVPIFIFFIIYLIGYVFF